MRRSDYLGDLPAQFDFALLCEQLRSYSGKREKIRQLINEGEIIRVKKGLYALGPSYRRPYNTFVLANMLYGPSYISMQSALSHYGAIPESVSVISSMNPKRRKVFRTTVGEFRYHAVPAHAYPVGVDTHKFGDQFVLMATREKALLDLVAQSDVPPSQVEAFLSGLRLSTQFLESLDKERLAAIVTAYSRASVTAAVEAWSASHGQ